VSSDKEARWLEYWSKINHFKPHEFDSPGEYESGLLEMNPSTIEKLNDAREIAGIPFVINSGYRTPAHNRKIGGVANSSHIHGYAVDIAVTNSSDRYKIIEACVQVGFNRIGIGRTFVHVDNDPSKVKGVLWHYYPSRAVRVMRALGFSPRVDR